MSRLSSARVRRAAVGAALAVVATSAGTAASMAPAASATSADCPATYTIADLGKGQAVNGVTVSSGTTPEGFTGTYIGKLTDGIAPGVDMLIMKLSSPQIDEAGGIWEGMSGSPVYAADGKIIGAVAYGLAWGSSPIAGITPYADMQQEAPADAATAVALSSGMQQRIVATGGTTARQAASGMEQGDTPLGVSGFGRHTKRLHRAAKKFGYPTRNVYSMGAAATGSDSAVDDLVAGGNVAATIAYGDVTAGGVGTVTTVCGDDVLAFGHPAFFSGPTTMTMHGAEALYIQPDSLGVAFKVANIGVPVGTVRRDGLTAIDGTLASPPQTTDITATTTYGDRTRDGSTHVSVPDALPDMAATHLLVDGDRMFDGIRGGSAVADWTLTGQRADGTPWEFSWTDRYSNGYDLTFSIPYTLYGQIARLQRAGGHGFTVDDIQATLDLADQQRVWRISAAEVRDHGRWRSMHPRGHLLARPGQKLRLRITLTSGNPDLGTRVVHTRVTVPRKAAGRPAMLSAAGGQFASYGGGFFFRKGGTSLDQALHQLRTSPHNDQVVAALDVFRRRQGLHRETRTTTAAVVHGHRRMQVQVMPRRR